MRYCLFLTCVLAVPGLAADAPKPNIVFFLADDLGYADVGFHGSEIKTPSIDKLAMAGAKLESFYVQPVCSPTRAALMTGATQCGMDCRSAWCALGPSTAFRWRSERF